MICDICGEKGARIRRVTETYGKGKKLLVIKADKRYAQKYLIFKTRPSLLF